MSGPDAAEVALAGFGPIPLGADGPVFPAPWAARAFALAVALNERGAFAWSEWAAALAAALADGDDDPADPEAYWRCWLAALEKVLAAKQLARPGDLLDLQDAWRRAAEATPHGQPIILPARDARAT